jgi:hypothetical protein
MNTTQESSVISPKSRAFQPLGKALLMMHDNGEEVLMAGPAGTGKSRACLEKVHLVSLLHPGCRVLLARKTRKSITQSTMVTFEEKVLPVKSGVRYVGQPYDEYRYPNGSTVVLSGLDDPEKVKSAEFDMAYINEATELTVHDWEMVSSRLRNGVVPWAGQLLADCNPAGPKHWLRQRALTGLTKMYESRHEDNPMLFDVKTGKWTPFGAAYIGKLDRLTGARYKRLRHGIWAAAEGMVYEGWDPAIHVVDRFPLPAEWRRFISIDFGYNNAFVAQWWALTGDGVLIRYREIYVTGRLVMDLAPRIVELSRGEDIEAVICDHDAEDRATLEKLRVRNIRAKKNLSAGLQLVADRLVISGKRPRVLFMVDSLVSPAPGAAARDPELEEANLPCCTEEEFESYVWQRNVDNTWNKDKPVDENNHGLDAARYMVAHLDLVDTQVQNVKRQIGARRRQTSLFHV